MVSASITTKGQENEGFLLRNTSITSLGLYLLNDRQQLESGMNMTSFERHDSSAELERKDLLAEFVINNIEQDEGESREALGTEATLEGTRSLRPALKALVIESIAAEGTMHQGRCDKALGKWIRENSFDYIAGGMADE